MNDFLSTPLAYLKGIGPAKAELLQKELSLFTFHDLLFHFPYRHIDRSKVYKIRELQADMPYIQVKGVLSNLRTLGTKGTERLVAELRDETGMIELVWFQGHKWIKDSLKSNQVYLAFGKPNAFNNQINIVHPNLDDPEDAANKKYLHIMPLYHCTERMKARGIDAKAIMKWINTLLLDPRLQIAETLSQEIMDDHKLLGRMQAIQQVHFPNNLAVLAQANYRLKFEEFFYIQLKLLRYKVKRHQLFNGIKLAQIGDQFNSFFHEHLPFELTNAQKRVLKEIRLDVKAGFQMNRLVQGDVGSGKTVVALMSMLMTLDNGYQACMMAPTEILANQHFITISSLVKDMAVRVKLLTGSTSAKEKRLIYAALEAGEIDILVGTHALIESKVNFKNLGMAIVDEQHRFGVEQRARLWQKNSKPPHVLVMTATPIPRTLAMT
ncbi:MAG: ATP-dependent DNA helicase RecG, partial [Bacteroidia bacterium]